MAANHYKEVEVLKDEDGVIAIITQRQDTGSFSFAIMKSYEKDGKFVRTSFLGRRHLQAAKRLLVKVEDWIDLEVDRSTARRAAR